MVFVQRAEDLDRIGVGWRRRSDEFLQRIWTARLVGGRVR